MTELNLKQWNEAGKDTYEAFKALVELNQKVLERSLSFQRELMETAVADINTNAQKAGKAADFQTLVELQADTTRESAKQMLENTQKAYELLEESRGEFSNWAEAQVKQVLSNTRVA